MTEILDKVSEILPQEDFFIRKFKLKTVAAFLCVSFSKFISRVKK